MKKTTTKGRHEQAPARDELRADPEPLNVARRCVEIYNAERERDPEGESGGAEFFTDAVDDVMAHGSEGLAPHFHSDYFLPLFAKAGREPQTAGPYAKLKALIAKVDAGANLGDLYAEDERRRARRKAAGSVQETRRGLSVERVRELVEIIVPLPGCEVESGDAVAVALNELVTRLTDKNFVTHDGLSPDTLADYVAEAAYNRTMEHNQTLEAWRLKTVAAAG